MRPACTDKDYFYTHTACDAQGEVGSTLREPVSRSLHPVVSELTGETPQDLHGEPRLAGGGGGQEHGILFLCVSPRTVLFLLLGFFRLLNPRPHLPIRLHRLHSIVILSPKR